MTRYALYFAPAPDSPWWRAGCRWLGRDPVDDSRRAQPAVAGMPSLMLEKLTSDARRYGFHATLKAPFRLAEGCSESHLATMVQAFAAVQQTVVLADMQVQTLGDYLALRPAAPPDALAALALRCVRHFDILRAPPSAAELARRRHSGLSSRQESLLLRWGYPYVGEEYRFHMTLSDSLAGVDEDTVHALRKGAEQYLGPTLQSGPLTIDAITVFREQCPGRPFSIWRRFPFGDTKTAEIAS